MNKKILIIEDDAIIKDNTAELLELAGYDVVTASNGKEGVKEAKSHLPDIIICDIMMPELDGYGVLYLLNKDVKTSSIPFIFLTAKTEKSDIRKGMALGADDYLTKPFDEMDLLKAIEGRLKRIDVLTKEYSKDKDGIDDFINTVQGFNNLEDIKKDTKIKGFKKKQIIYHEGDYPNVLFMLTKGKVKTYKIHDDGKEYITSLIKEGEYFGYLPIMEDRPYNDFAVAMEDCEVCRIPKLDFIKLLEKNRDVANKFIKMISNNLVEKEELLLSLAYDTVRKRVANALVSLKDRFETEGEDRFKLEISRSDLASMAGTASESVIRTLADFKDENLILVSGKEITITNLNGLKKIW